jgi:hypothetical protein
MTRISAAALYLMLWKPLNWPRGFGLSPSGIPTEAFNSKLNPRLFPVAALVLNMAGKVISSETHGA